MLIDDNPHDNFFHERAIKESQPDISVLRFESPIEALEYIQTAGLIHKNPVPVLIFLDINMPEMNGWEFLEEYEKLHEEIKNHVIIVMLTTSDDLLEKQKSKQLNVVSGFITKPLTKQLVDEVFEKYF